MPDYPMLTPGQVNPWNAALKQAFSTYGEGLKAAYAKPNLEQALLKAKQANIYNPKIWESEIGLRGAQAGLAGSEAVKNQFLVNHPEYINPDAALLFGRPGENNQSNGNGMQQGGSPQQAMGSPNIAGASPTDQQNIDQMKPGQSYVIGSGQSPNEQGQSTKQGQQPQQQQSGGQNQMPNAEQYDPAAFAFNMPKLPTTGNQQRDAALYKRYGLSPEQQTKLDLAKELGSAYQTEMIKKTNEFSDQAQIANQSTIDAHKFLNALEHVNTLQTGHFGGLTPGITDATQNMDNAGHNLVQSSTLLFKNGQAIHGGDITLNQLSKPNRRQNPSVSFDLAQGIIAKNDRIKERQQFYSTGMLMHLSPPVLDSLWNKYETERPYMDSDTKMPNDSYKGTWKDYLTPQSVNAFVRGEDYTPPNQRVLQGMSWSEGLKYNKMRL